MAYCESCDIATSYEENELSGDSKCCNSKLLATKPKNVSNNGSHNNLVEQSKRYRRHIEGENSRKMESSEIGQILGPTLEKLKPTANIEEEGNGQ